jgi:sugar lactone lactonase YvrE
MATARVHNHATSAAGPRARHRRRSLAPLVAVAAAATLSLGTVAVTSTAGASPKHHGFGHQHSFLAGLDDPSTIGATVPSNGDQNPYGIATVPWSTGALVRGDTLVSNFNASYNAQGTGTTIVELSPTGSLTVFAQLDGTLPGACPGGVGLTTALAVLPDGYVVVGSLPVPNMGTGTPQAGCLIVLNSEGQAVETWSGPAINGPWDLTAQSFGDFTQLYVTNVLNGTVAAAPGPTSQGTVLRIDVWTHHHHAPQVLSETVIGTGFPEQLNGSALVIGPTGVALGWDGTLYVADTLTNRIAAIPHAAFRHSALNDGITVSEGGGLNAPLGLMTAPNGNVIAANGGDGNAVEVSPNGTQVDVAQLDPLNNGGDLFGLTLTPQGRGILFVDDGDNSLRLLDR